MDVNTIIEYASKGAIMATGGELAKSLWNKIWEIIKTYPNAEKALSEAREANSEEVFKEKMLPYLQIAMNNEDFVKEITDLVKKIQAETNNQKDSINNKVIARDNVNTIGKIGDNATIQTGGNKTEYNFPKQLNTFGKIGDNATIQTGGNKIEINSPKQLNTFGKTGDNTTIQTGGSKTEYNFPKQQQ